MPNPTVRRVIDAAHLPMRMPLWPTATLWLLLDRLQMPGWVWGATGLFILTAWGVWINDVRTRETIPLDDLLKHRKE